MFKFKPQLYFDCVQVLRNDPSLAPAMLKVKTTCYCINVQHLSGQIKVGQDFRRHVLKVDLFQIHTTGGYKLILVCRPPLLFCTNSKQSAEVPWQKLQKYFSQDQLSKATKHGAKTGWLYRIFLSCPPISWDFLF